MTVIVAIIHTGIALNCYKCPIRVRDLLHCNDPFENKNYQTTCSRDEDVCLKVTVTGSKNHIEERGCANKNSVDIICNNVKRNIPTDDVSCLICETDLCNGSSRREITTTTVLCFMPLSFVLIKIFAPVT
jgi:hypothetical protein